MLITRFVAWTATCESAPMASATRMHSSRSSACGTHPLHEADAVGLRSRCAVGGQEHPSGVTERDHPWEQVDGDASEDAQLWLAQPEPRVLGGDADVAVESEFDATADG